MYNRHIYDAIWAGSGPYNLTSALEPCNVCADQKQVPYLFKQSALVGQNRQASFEDVSPLHDPSIITALKQSIEQGGFVSLIGNPGSGKTYLLAAAVSYAIETYWKRSVFTSTPTLLDHLRSTYRNQDRYSFDDYWDNIEHADVLAIDEFDESSGTDWANEQILKLVDDRYNRWQECCTIFGIKDFDKLTASVKSRLKDFNFTIVLMQGQDLRLVNRKDWE